MDIEIVLSDEPTYRLWIEGSEGSDDLVLRSVRRVGKKVEKSSLRMYKYEYRQGIVGSKNWRDGVIRGAIPLYDESSCPCTNSGLLEFECEERGDGVRANYQFFVRTRRGGGRKEVGPIRTNRTLEDIRIPYRDQKERQKDWDKVYM